MINDALRYIRKFNGYTAKDLAIELDISPSYLSEIETGKKMPNLDLIYRYGRVFDMKPSTILFFAEDIEPDVLDSKAKRNTRFITMKFMNILEKFGELDD